MADTSSRPGTISATSSPTSPDTTSGWPGSLKSAASPWRRSWSTTAASDFSLSGGAGHPRVAPIPVDNARLTRELSASEERYRFLIERSPDLVWQVDHEENLVFLN